MADLDTMPCPTCLTPCDVREVGDGWALRCPSCGYEGGGPDGPPTLRKLMAGDGSPEVLWGDVDLAGWTAMVVDAVRAEGRGDPERIEHASTEAAWQERGRMADLAHEDFHRFTQALAYVSRILATEPHSVAPSRVTARFAMMDLQTWLCAVHAAAQLPAEPVAYSPTDPTTWTRAQLEAELLARMGLRAPEGWEWDEAMWCSYVPSPLRDGPYLWAWHQQEEDGNGEALPGMEWGLGRNGALQMSGTAPTLTGPDGAFAQAERAAVVRDA